MLMPVLTGRAFYSSTRPHFLRLSRWRPHRYHHATRCTRATFSLVRPARNKRHAMPIDYELVPEDLGLRNAAFVGAFLGFPDASMGASGAVRFLVESLRAAPLATWDGDEFYDFAELRPVSRVVPPRDRTLVWPQAELWVVREVAPASDTGEPRSLVLFLAAEPRLRWKAYARELAQLAKRCSVTQAVFFGSAFADIPHTRPPIITGWATEPRLRTRLEAIGVPFSAYQGPSSMQSAGIEIFREAGIACASLFSNGPHYLPVPNANLSVALLRRLGAVLDVRLDLEPLREAGEALVRQATAAMEERPEFQEHVRQLEARFDEQAAPLAPGEVRRTEELRAQQEGSGPLNVDPQDVVRELEDFLRRRGREQRGTPDEESPPPPSPPEPPTPPSTPPEGAP